MKVPREKVEKARELRFAGRSMRESARLAGLSPATLRKHEKGWTDAEGVHHAGWRADLKVAQLKSVAAATTAGAELLDRDERVGLYAEVASVLIGKVRKALPHLQVKGPREAKLLLSEARELSKLIAQETSAGETHPPGVKQDITYEELRERYEAAMQVEVDEIPPPEKPYAMPDCTDLIEPRAAKPRRRVRDVEGEERDADKRTEELDDE